MKLVDVVRSSTNNLFASILFFFSQKKGGKKLLLVKLEGLGDFIIFIPSLLKYREMYPDYEITLLVDNKINYEIAQRYIGKYIDKVHLFDAKKFSKKLLYRFEISKNIYKENYTVAIHPIYYRRKIGDFLIRISNANERIGYKGYETEKLHISLPSKTYYSKLITVPPTIKNEFLRHKYFIEQIGRREITNYETAFPLTEKDVEDAEKILSLYGVIRDRYVALFPGAGRAVSKWPPRKFAETIKFIVSKQLKVVILGSPAEKSIAEEILSYLSPEEKASVVDLSTKTDIFVTAGIIKLATLYLGNDSGPTHLSEAIKQITICPLGLGHYKEFYPSEDTPKTTVVKAKNRECYDDAYACATIPNTPAPCVEDIAVDDVITEINKII